MAITNEQQTQILKIVVGLYNAGLNGSILSELAQLVDNGMSMAQLSDLLAANPLFTNEIMGGKVTVQDQTDVMMEHFGLVADNDPTSAGSLAEAHFKARIESGTGFGAIVYEAVIFLEQSNLPAEFAPTATLLNNKALTSEVYAGTNTPGDFPTLVALMTDVTTANPTTQEEATVFVDDFISNSSGNTTTILTEDADNLTGTPGADSYSGIFDPDGDSTTISNADVINGVGGTDELNVRIASLASNEDTIAPVISNVENFFLTNQNDDSRDFTFNFINVEDEVQVWDKGSVLDSETYVFNVDPTTTIGMADTLIDLFGVHFSGEGDRSGSADAFTLELTGAGTMEEQTAFVTIDDDFRNDNTFEIANITSTETLSNVEFSSMTLETVNVSGDAALMLDGSFSELSMIDASQMTAGGLDIDADGSNETGFNFMGSSADDRVILKNSTINTASSLDGGTGKNTLATQNFSNLDVSEVNQAVGFDVLEGYDGAESINDVSAYTDINEFLFSGNTGNNSGYTMSNIESNDLFVFSTDISSGGNRALRLEGKNAGNSATVELRAIDEENGETVIQAQSNNNDNYGIELPTNIASFTLDSTGTSTLANVIQSTSNDWGYAFGNETTSVFDITGSHDLSIMAKIGVDISNGNKLAGFSHAVNVDASTFTGVLRIAGSIGNDVIQGGSEADIIYGLGGADTLTGNEGADQFRFAEYSSAPDTLTDFIKGTDKVGLNEFDFANTAETQAGATLSTADYVENRAGITSIGSADDKKVIELQTSLNSDQIANDVGADVDAFILVHNTTTGKAELWYDNNWSNSGRDHIATYDDVVDLVGVQDFSNTDFVEYSY